MSRPVMNCHCYCTLTYMYVLPVQYCSHLVSQTGEKNQRLYRTHGKAPLSYQLSETSENSDEKKYVHVFFSTPERLQTEMRSSWFVYVSFVGEMSWKQKHVVICIYGIFSPQCKYFSLTTVISVSIYKISFMLYDIKILYDTDFLSFFLSKK